MFQLIDVILLKIGQKKKKKKKKKPPSHPSLPTHTDQKKANLSD